MPVIYLSIAIELISSEYVYRTYKYNFVVYIYSVYYITCLNLIRIYSSISEVSYLSIPTISEQNLHSLS